MAERRMFQKTIIDSDTFLDMPLSAQCLYFHLCMRADDEGFINNPKRVQRIVGASEDDLKILAVKQFIIPFESGVVVIRHWKIHNYIRKDRYKDTEFKEERGKLGLNVDNSYTLDNTSVNQMATKCIPSDSQVSPSGIGIGLGLDIGYNLDITNTLVQNSVPMDSILDEFDEVWKLYPKKEGKLLAEKHYRKARKDGVTQETIIGGLKRYLRFIEVKGVSKQFVKMGSTWFCQRCWEDEYDLTPNNEKAQRDYTGQYANDSEQGYVDF